VPYGYAVTSFFCKFSLTIIEISADDPEELNEDSNQLPGVPYQVEYAFPYLDLDSIPKSDPREKAQYV